MLLAVYVDDVLVIGSDKEDIEEIKEHLRTHFVTKDMEKPRYFLDIEFAYANGKMTLSQRKYVLDLLQETGLLRCKPESTTIEQSPFFWDTSSELLEDLSQYRRLIEKFIYLTFPIHSVYCVSSCMSPEEYTRVESYVFFPMLKVLQAED